MGLFGHSNTQPGSGEDAWRYRAIISGARDIVEHTQITGCQRRTCLLEIARIGIIASFAESPDQPGVIAPEQAQQFRDLAARIAFMDSIEREAMVLFADEQDADTSRQ